MASWLFTRLLGVIFLIAFLSLFSQLMGLAGSQGILPASDKLHEFQAQYGSFAPIIRPSLLWLDSSDFFLQILSIVGICASTALILGLVPGVSLLLCWVIYLSFANAVVYFLGFQWDEMLLECGFLSLFMVPCSNAYGWKRQKSPPGQTVVMFLLRWMLFRVMFCSGLAKLLGGCAAWLNFSALGYYWETQLLPNQLAWYLFAMPAWFQTMGAVVTFSLEIVAPLFLFAKRSWRIAAAIVLILLQTAMLCTGNHGFINVLTAALCVTLLDDECLKRFFPKSLTECLLDEDNLQSNESNSSSNFAKSKQLCSTTAVGAFLALTVSSSVATIFPNIAFSQSLRPTFNVLLSGYHLTGFYGLYPVVNTERREIIIEGSNDGHEWKPYIFKYHLGPIDRAPPSVSFHQPRLDWRMRFAALGTSTLNPWMSAFVQRLLQGSKPVLALLEDNPFKGKPPKFVRADLYNYQFTSPEVYKKSGDWWQRQLIGHYLPVTSLAEPGVRSMVCASTWYPDEPGALQNLLQDLEKRARLRPKPNFASGKASDTQSSQRVNAPLAAILAPHAAYRYSGVGAMRAYLEAKDRGPKPVKRIILLGPLHPMYRLNLHGALLSSDQAFATPLGNISLDTQAVHRLAKLPNFSINEKAQATEHSLEMQLPLLNSVFKGIPIVPILLATGKSQESIASIATGLKSELKSGDLIIVSGDMTHWGKIYNYQPFKDDVRNNVQKLDQEAYGYIAKFDETGLSNFKERTKENMCGFEPIAVLLEILPKDSRSEVIEYYTSQDAMPKPLGSEADQCIGYLSIGFSKSEKP